MIPKIPTLLTGLCLATAFSGDAQEPRRPPLPPETVTVEAPPLERIRLSVSVLDPAGEPVTGLSREDFLVLERGVPQRILDFSREAERQDRPLSAVFLVDTSMSMGAQLSRWREACASLARALRPVDEVMVATFAGDLAIVQEFTRDVALLEASLAGFRARTGGSSIFGAVDEALERLADRPGRKAIFLLTDGIDTGEQFRVEWTTESNTFLRELVQRAIQSETTVVVILPGAQTFPSAQAVQDLALATGGWWLYPSDDLPGLVRRLGERLLESYYVAYDSSWPLADRRRRTIEVTLARPGLSGMTVRTARGISWR